MMVVMIKQIVATINIFNARLTMSKSISFSISDLPCRHLYYQITQGNIIIIEDI